MEKNKKTGYNERLFDGGVRGYFHGARYKWISESIKNINCPVESIIELGCFDGKLIDFLPVLPQKYYGYDANWENGLDLAKVKWKNYRNYVFQKATRADDIVLADSVKVDLLVAMETLEHIPDESLDGYLEKLSRHLNGYFLITVPNEKGVIFLGKYVAKKFLRGGSEKYSFSEIINATFGRLSRVERREHKGFDYDILICRIGRYFEITHVAGFPFKILPKSLCFSIGIVAKSKNTATMSREGRCVE